MIVAWHIIPFSILIFALIFSLLNKIELKVFSIHHEENASNFFKTNAKLLSIFSLYTFYLHK